MNALFEFLRGMFARASVAAVVPRSAPVPVAPHAQPAGMVLSPKLPTINPDAKPNIQLKTVKDYATLAPEYQALWNLCVPDRRAQEPIKALLAHKDRYAAVHSNIPWWFVAVIHMMEAAGNFGTCLHNGDPLPGPTKHVPAGRGPFSNWEEGARDALAEFTGLKTWTVPEVCHRLERYNGFGYRRTGRPPSPYLWSFSNLERPGKYAADGKYVAGMHSGQVGAATMLKALALAGHIDIKPGRF